MHALGRLLFTLGVIVNLVPPLRSILGGFRLFGESNMNIAFTGAALCVVGFLLGGFEEDGDG